jgi:hypothetical protein
MRKAFPHRRRAKFSWGLATLLLVAVAAVSAAGHGHSLHCGTAHSYRIDCNETSCLLLQILLLLQASQKNAPSAWHVQPAVASSSSTKKQQAVQSHVHALLHKCPLPGYCIRDEGLPGPDEYLSSSGPGHAGMQRQHALITQHLNSSSFQVSIESKSSNPVQSNATIRRCCHALHCDDACSELTEPQLQCI